MLICLDYDHTYTADPRMWDLMIPAFQAYGHTVILATHRDDRYDKTSLLLKLETIIPVFYTRGVAKKWYLEQFAPPAFRNPSIWVDDKPEAILHNSTATRDVLDNWRSTRTEANVNGSQE